MPWPQFSELSFGFAFLREFERLHSTGGQFPKAPDFITQNAEAEKGYDVEVLNNSVPVFFQFKRSFVLTNKNAREIQKGDFLEPNLFRMYLHDKNGYAQHTALQNHESSGKIVFYVTSQIEDQSELTANYVNGSVLGYASALFSPLEIILPNTHEEHYVTFEANADYGYVYSEDGHKFERSYQNSNSFISRLNERRRSADENKEALSQFASSLAEASPQAARLAARFEDPVIRASVLAYAVLDAHLVFYGGSKAPDSDPEADNKPSDPPNAKPWLR